MSTPVELYELESILRQTREELARRSLSVPVRERWEKILRRASCALEIAARFHERCGHCGGGGSITRPLLKDVSGVELPWPSDYPRQIRCPYCRGSGLVDRPDDGDVAYWGESVSR